MQTNELSNLVINVLEDNKAQDITVMDVSPHTDIADEFIICTATSTRHASALADKVVVAAKTQQHPPLGVEGQESAEWILIDLADIVVHIMLQSTREFYSLEKLWNMAENVREKTA